MHSKHTQRAHTTLHCFRHSFTVCSGAAGRLFSLPTSVPLSTAADDDFYTIINLPRQQAGALVVLGQGGAASACQLSTCQVGISQLHALHIVLLLDQELAILDQDVQGHAGLLKVDLEGGGKGKSEVRRGDEKGRGRGCAEGLSQHVEVAVCDVCRANDLKWDDNERETLCVYVCHSHMCV